ncbi:hypothetical protein [Arenimonas composti]|uniref:hypothetical protein n=1 Tax=Arenimonas composti TaxID=370776 RepID=UPI0012B642BF|nr:hypothetical protein [Arenimonas composti]
MIEDAKNAGLAIDKIAVLGSERLASWCDLHPAISWRFAGNTTSLVTIDRWATSQQHRVEWQASDRIEAILASARGSIDPRDGDVLHLHIEGLPGVGKTRFALELCKKAEWAADVLYVRQAAEVEVGQIIQSIVSSPNAELVVVVDEVQANQLLPLREMVGYAEGRVRLVTIGHSRTPDPDQIPSIRIEPLDEDQMKTLVGAWHEGMPAEHIDFVVTFADGFVRLAQLAASAVARNPAGSVRDLLDQQHIRQFLDQMLGQGPRHALYVVAALTTVGWDDEVSGEGEAISKHLGLDWRAVKAEVERFDREFGIAPRGGRRRYISPTPLAAHLAVEAWAAMPDVMRTLPEALPSETARLAYFERVRTIATTPFAREFAIEELKAFFDLAAFRTESDIKRWAALSAAAPLLAARGAWAALKDSSLVERQRISGASRRFLVSTLVRLASRSNSFREAAMSLALLAEAENEGFSNNSTKELGDLFQVHLGGTAAPYSERIKIAEELVAFRRDTLTRVVIGALARVAELNEVRIVDTPGFGVAKEVEWRPQTPIERASCIESAIGLLTRILNENPGVEEEIVRALPAFSYLLPMHLVRDRVLEFMRVVGSRSEVARKSVVAILAKYMDKESRYWHRLSESAKDEVYQVLAAFEPRNLVERIEIAVGSSPWDKAPEFSFEELAKELDAQTIKSLLPWLTSGEASDAWRFGEAVCLGRDLRELGDLLRQNESSFGSDLRFVFAVVGVGRRELGDDWFNSWLAAIGAESPRGATIAIEAIWRVGATRQSLEAGQELLRSASREAIRGLAFGDWYLNSTDDVLVGFLWRVLDEGECSVVLTIVDQLTKNRKVVQGVEALVEELLGRPELVRSNDVMTEYHWKELALRFLEGNVGLVLTTVLAAHATRDSRSWFIEFSQVKEVVERVSIDHPERFWEGVRFYLEDPAARGLFTIGFPGGLLEDVPYDVLKKWASVDPEDRVGLLVRLVESDFSTPTSLASMLLEDFGGSPRVDDAFFASYVSGGWSGPASLHWFKLAEGLEQLCQSRDGYFRSWARGAIASLEAMGARDLKREEEEAALQRGQ